MKHVAIRLDEAEYKRLRVAVAQQGTTIQNAVQSAIARYLEDLEAHTDRQVPEADLRGFLRNTDVMELMEQDRKDELERDRRRV